MFSIKKWHRASNTDSKINQLIAMLSNIAYKQSIAYNLSMQVDTKQKKYQMRKQANNRQTFKYFKFQVSCDVQV